MRWLPALAALAALTACVDAATSPDGRLTPAFAVDTVCNVSYAHSPLNFNRHWSCGQAIALYTTTSRSAEVQAARDAWNAALHGDSLGLPHFVPTFGSPISVGGATAGVNFAGQTLPMLLTATPTSINMTTGTSGDYLPVLMVEVSHVVGYADAWEPYAATIPGVTDHCTRSASGVGGVYTITVPCQHEIEGVYAAYGLRAADPDQHKHIITGIGLRGDTTIAATDSLPAAVLSLLFSRANPAFPEGNHVSEASYAWTSSNPTVASVTGANTATPWIHANAVGTATIKVNFSSLGPYELTALWGRKQWARNTFTVTVTAAPPPNQFHYTGRSCAYNGSYPGYVYTFSFAGPSVAYKFYKMRSPSGPSQFDSTTATLIRSRTLTAPSFSITDPVYTSDASGWQSWFVAYTAAGGSTSVITLPSQYLPDGCLQ